MQNLSTQAKGFAKIHHGEQKRRYTDEPYCVHPQAVAEIVSLVIDSTDEMVAAAHLHDLVEDVPLVTHGLIERTFGPIVFTYVYFLTDISRPEDGNRYARKEIDLVHNVSGPAEVHTIKVADLIDNSHSIRAHDPNFAVIYMHEMERSVDALWAADESLKIVARKIIATHKEEKELV